MNAHELMQDGAKTVTEAVKFTGIGRTEMYRMMSAGEIAFAQHGKRRLIPVIELRRVLAEMLINTKQPKNQQGEAS